MAAADKEPPICTAIENSGIDGSPLNNTFGNPRATKSKSIGKIVSKSMCGIVIDPGINDGMPFNKIFIWHGNAYGKLKWGIESETPIACAGNIILLRL